MSPDEAVSNHWGEGTKLIYHNAAKVSQADDPSYPFRLTATFHIRSKFIATALGIPDAVERIIIRGMTLKVLENGIESNGFKTNPNLITLEILEPESVH